MEAVIIIFALAVIGLEIFILIKFFGLCNDVSMIRKNQLTSVPEKVNKQTVHYYAMLDRHEEIYRIIVERLYTKLGLTKNSDKQAGMIKLAEELCSIIGKTLPKGLRSADEYNATFGNNPDE